MNKNSNEKDTLMQELSARLDSHGQAINSMQNIVKSLSTQIKVVWEDSKIIKQQLSREIPVENLSGSNLQEKTTGDLELENDSNDDDSISNVSFSETIEEIEEENGNNSNLLTPEKGVSDLELRLASLRELPIREFMSDAYFNSLSPKKKIAHTFWLQNNFKLKINHEEYFLWMEHIKNSEILENKTLLESQSKKLMEWELIKFNNTELIKRVENKMLSNQFSPILKEYVKVSNIHMLVEKMNHKYSKNEKNFSKCKSIDFNDKDFILSEKK